MLERTPLWYYVLCEAEAREGGIRLGPIGGRIVARTLLGLLLRRPRVLPGDQARLDARGVLRGAFATLADFVHYAQGR